jgi:hypothetical protein
MCQLLREMIDQWDYMKLKSFCITKEMVIKSKRQLTEWEKIFANFPSDKRNNNKNMQGAQKTELPKNQ